MSPALITDTTQDADSSSQNLACNICHRDFKSLQSLNQHLTGATKHKRCRVCRKGFDGISNYLSHQKTHDAAAQQDIQDEISRLGVSNTQTGNRVYNGESPREVAKVFGLSNNLRSSRPTAGQIAQATNTTLDLKIVASILQGALTLLTPDYSPAGTALRRSQELEKAKRAAEAETAFVEQFSRRGIRFMREAEQRARNAAEAAKDPDLSIRSTPDVLFDLPTIVCGITCHWIEYKHNFGFRVRPFVARRNRQQVARYQSTFGTGMLVYSLGYEYRHLRIEGVHCFREADVVKWLDENVAT